MHLVDTSVWVRARRSADLRAELADHVAADAIAICHPVLFELVFSARNADEFRFMRDAYEAYPFVAVDDEVWRRALDVNEEVARQGGLHHRQVRQPDLLIAAAAELAGIPVLHYDADDDRIAAVTGQATRWVRPRGSL
jgi:predicted nucleic acid-binding protein